MITQSVAATDRQDLLDGARGSWNLAVNNSGAPVPLSASAGVLLNQPPQGVGAALSRNAATLNAAYFNAGDSIDLSGNQLTIYLRAWTSTTAWNSGLIAKRGSLATLNYNLFAVDLPGTTGNDIGFEIRTQTGFHQISFPMAQVGGPAWLDIVARYDGERLQLYCNGRLMADKPTTGNLLTNNEPLLIGAETNAGAIVRPFTGQMEEAAIFDRAVSDQEIALLSRTPTIWTDAAVLVHHRQPDHPVGDFRPHYIDGEFVVSYLYNPGTWNCAILRSTDLLNWTQEVPTHSPAEVNQAVPNYFVLSFLHDPSENKWRSYYGYAGMRSSLSTDLSSWDATTPHLLIPSRPTQYARESDPYVFWNEDTNNYWMVMTLGRLNEPVGQRGAVGWATSTNMRSWINRGELYYPGDKGDPECPSMFKIGDTWYLLASWYNAAVGAPLYRMSTNPQGPWTTPTPDQLDGKDFCAGFSVQAGDRRVMFAWIPLLPAQPGNQFWGGHMAFPREIIQFPDATLGTLLAEEYQHSLTGPSYFPQGATVLTPRIGSWIIDGSNVEFSSPTQGGIAAFEGTFQRVVLKTNLEFTADSRSARVYLDWSPSQPGYWVVIDKLNERLAIETVGGTVHADIPLRDVGVGTYPLLVYVEEDMVEVFFANRTSLCARIPKKLQATSVAIGADRGPTRFHDLTLSYMNGLNEAVIEIPGPSDALSVY
jgi:sucrose-6-phosphate hydrolase SacC (GH32 family)